MPIAQPSSGLVARWLLNEPSGSILVDYVGGYNISIGGSPSRVLTSYRALGSTHVLSINTGSQYGYVAMPTLFAHTLTSWVYVSSTLSAIPSTWLGYGTGHAGDNFFMDVPSVIAGGPSSVLTLNFPGGTLSLNAWYFVASTFDGNGNWVMYSNAGGSTLLSAKTSASQHVISGTPILAIGNNFGLGNPFGAGYLGEIRLYNRALSAAEIQAVYGS